MAPAPVAVQGSAPPLSRDSYCAHCTRAAALRRTWPDRGPCSPAPSVRAPVQLAPGSPSGPACALALRCFTGHNNRGSIRANRASVRASSRSSSFRLAPIKRTLRACATITSRRNSLSTRLTQGECIPVSNAIRQRGIAPNTSRVAFVVVPSFCSSRTSPTSSSRAVPTRSIAQVQPDGQFLLAKILRHLFHCTANLLHCRSPLSISCASKRVDNLGAYSIPSESGLLIPSDNNS
jgi:hypothetical protein